MIISKSLEWTRPYIEDIALVIPKVKKIKKIHAMGASLHKIASCYAQLTVDNKSKRHVISIYTNYATVVSLKPFKRVIKPFSKVDILQTLAHELAHVLHWDHTPEHKIVENTIAVMMMQKLQADGYISEEHELGIKKH